MVRRRPDGARRRARGSRARLAGDHGDLLWDDLAADDAGLAAWCAERWLGAYRRLEAPPPSLPATRLALHRLAEHVLTPARQRANGKIALRYVAGGFGTPFFGDDVQVRVEGAELVVDSPRGERRAPLGSLAAAAAHVGMPLEVADEPLEVDEAASRFLGDWYGFTTSVLEQLRAEAAPELEASRAQLWTEHFDLAVELGAKDAGRPGRVRRLAGRRAAFRALPLRGALGGLARVGRRMERRRLSPAPSFRSPSCSRRPTSAPPRSTSSAAACSALTS